MSNDELQLVCLIRDYPLITVEQLVTLTGRPMQSVGRSLKKLCSEPRPYINRNRNRQSINTKYVYAVTRHGAADKNIGGYPIDLSERRDQGLKHEALINDVHIAMKDQVTVWVQDRKTLWRNGVQPDAFFKLQSGEKKRSYFLEVETGTNNHLDVVAKYKGYEKLRRLLKEMTKEEINLWLPMTKFSVLTIRPTAESAHALQKEVLKEKIIDEKYKDFYLFTSLPISVPLI